MKGLALLAVVVAATAATTFGAGCAWGKGRRYHQGYHDGLKQGRTEYKIMPHPTMTLNPGESCYIPNAHP